MDHSAPSTPVLLQLCLTTWTMVPPAHLCCHDLAAQPRMWLPRGQSQQCVTRAFYTAREVPKFLRKFLHQRYHELWTPGECTHVVIQTELSRFASGQAAQCESPWRPGSTTQEQGITVTAGRSISWPAFLSGRASPPSACSAHPPSPAPPLLLAVSRWAPGAPRGRVRSSCKVQK